MKNWEERIASYTEPQKEIYHRMFPIMDELIALKNEPKSKWRNIVNDKKKNVYIETKKSKRGFNMMRATGPIEFPPVDVFRVIELGGVEGGWDDTA